MEKLCLLFILIFSFGRAAELPTFIDKCNLTQTDTLSECMIKNGNKAIPHITKGVPQYNLPTMEPYTLPTYTLKDDTELRFIMRNLRVYGLERTKITYADLQADILTGKYTIPNIITLANYEMNGTLFGKNVYGAGRLNMTAVGLEIAMSTKYLISSDDYYFSYDSSSIFTASRVYFHFTNLYNGDENLGDEMNKIIDDNWMRFSSLVSPSIRKGYAEIFFSVFQSIADVVQWNNIYLH